MVKTITMTYEEYENEISEARGHDSHYVQRQLRAHQEGFEQALEMLKDFLESKLPFNKWYWKNRGTDDTPHPYWLNILVALGKEKQWSE